MAAKKKTPKTKTKTAPALKKKKKKVVRKAPRADDAKAFLPGRLVAHDGGKFSLIYSDFPHDDVFDEHGLQGGGYTWHGLVDHVLRMDAPFALKALDFDPEASMFAVVSKD